ncbi:MAG: bifunctional aldolase/short-chain dehydrogenase [Burkholderiales bacterium]|nr:bifunctional aldolase/short-chain dehydrogenase [Anaerolineae bacterium]
MQNLWNEQEAAQYGGDLAQCVYASRLLGRDKSLVLHGGGNTSVKIQERNLFGEDENILYVKGSGWDLETIQAAGFAPVRMAYLLKLAQLPTLTDTAMANELKLGMTRADAPAPSVEAILHAAIPHKFVLHTHADAILTVTNTADGEARIREIYGDTVVMLPYIMPGFKLAREAAEMLPSSLSENTLGMVLLNHGIFSFGETARDAYDRMIALVTRAEEYLQTYGAWQVPFVNVHRTNRALRQELAELRREISEVAGFPVIVATHDDDQSLAFVNRQDIAMVSQQGTATPDHIIRTKRLPLLGRDVAAFSTAYESYFAEHSPNAEQKLTMLDAAPRLLLDPELGVVTIGKTAKDAAIANDIYQHTIDIISRATNLGGYRSLPVSDAFDMEYWELEQAKLRAGGKPPVFTGEIALVTGAASGIGKACVESLLARGAAVIALDIVPEIVDLFKRPDYIGLQCDVSSEAEIIQAIESGVKAFGGLDILVLNAGIFPSSRRIEALPLAEWDKIMRINLDANLVIMREAHPLLKLAPRGGKVVIIASKNVPAPGPGVAAYSASKAALTQLGRVAALEWGADNIRVNMINPNAVFDTGLWTEDILQARAKHYGMSVDDYKTNNILHVAITSHDCAELVAELCGPLFAKTTGAQIPIDGGNDRVI